MTIIGGFSVLVVSASLDMGLGGHSLFSLTSSLAESPVRCDETLTLRGIMIGDVDEVEERLVCCSKRPMRFATLAWGRSSGRGLCVIATSLERSCEERKT